MLNASLSLNNPSPIIPYRNKFFKLDILTIIYSAITDKQATATVFGTIMCVCVLSNVVVAWINFCFQFRITKDR
jgi:hypothetical protein